MTAAVYSQEGKKSGQVELNEAVFGVEPDKDLLAQYLRVYQSRKRQGTVKTKTRGEVRGGGRKPWRQKGTGRARHGSIRSPSWVGGGVAHGPKPRDWKLKINQRLRRKALFCALSQKLREEGVLVLDKLELESAKTREFKKILEKLPVRDKKILLVLPEQNRSLILSARNLPGVDTIQANELNAYEVLSHDVAVFPKRSLVAIEEAFLKRGT